MLAEFGVMKFRDMFMELIQAAVGFMKLRAFEKGVFVRWYVMLVRKKRIAKLS